MPRVLGPLTLSAALAGCGAGSDCVEPEISGGWTESARSTMALVQTCEGAVTGRWTTRSESGAVTAEWNVVGRVEGTRFLWTGTCVDARCTYDTYTVDGSDGSGMEILDDARRLKGKFKVAGRALADFDFTRD